MTSELKYVIFSTHIGWIGILASAKGLLGTTLPQPSVQKTCQLLGKNVCNATWSPQVFDNLVERLKVYLNGHKAIFPDEIEILGVTSFQSEVWEKTRLIPYGETRSYLWVANQIGRPKAVRAVGAALSRNPLPIIVPCHRVVASNGKLGGFSGGVEMKRYLIWLEATADIG
ncbi:methylated-DNA--[protein]-cysteine S-methyltransferase [Chloroflexota bacterium]